MGFTTLTLKLPTHYTEQELRSIIRKQLKITDFSFQTEAKSLDARNKKNIHWLLRVGVHSDELKGGEAPAMRTLNITRKQRDEKIAVVGSGPAGFFCALVLQKAGFSVQLYERGSEVQSRGRAIQAFERGGDFDPKNNYAFGEGGAGTFSDGKLTSRSKHISEERQFVLSSYVKAGGPPEIMYMTHPHLGTDNLRKIVQNLRNEFEELGGRFYFETRLDDMEVVTGKVKSVITHNDSPEVDALFMAPGHSAYETYRMLMRKGVRFRTKNFAIGCRMEHPQEIINVAQWGRPLLSGVKAAEYRLTSQGDGKHSVYSFCMCPGGIVVPAAVYPQTNIVNGMSYYKRNGRFANAACVAGIHPDELSGKNMSPEDVLSWLFDLEHAFYEHTGNYRAPACNIEDFLKGKVTQTRLESSYPLGLSPAPLFDYLPKGITAALREGLKDFSRKIRGFEQGNLLGLESKTSSPIQVLRETGGLCSGFENLYMIGEGSGYAGGIISSAADGVKAAMHYIHSKG